MRLMSFALTTAHVRSRTKFVTRRLGWRGLVPGELVQPVEQAQGLKKGQQVARIGGPIRITEVRLERLDLLTDDPVYGAREIELEGGCWATPAQFVTFFCDTHRCRPDALVRRIQFEYVDAAQNVNANNVSRVAFWQRAAYCKLRTWEMIQDLARAGERADDLANDYQLPVDFVRFLLYPENDIRSRYYRQSDRVKTGRDRAIAAEAEAWSLRKALAALEFDDLNVRASLNAREDETTPAAAQRRLREYADAHTEITRLSTLVNTPELHDFAKAVVLEAAHQRERWDDTQKTDADWFWLIGYLAGKALHTPIAKDVDDGASCVPPDVIAEKRLHRIITIAAAASNWHAHVLARASGTEAGSR